MNYHLALPPPDRSKVSKPTTFCTIKSIAKQKTIRVTQIASPIGRQGYQKKCLIGLGLNKINRSRVFNAAYEKLEKWMKDNQIETL